jgi:hypothetical protein
VTFPFKHVKKIRPGVVNFVFIRFDFGFSNLEKGVLGLKNVFIKVFRMSLRCFE